MFERSVTYEQIYDSNGRRLSSGVHCRGNKDRHRRGDSGCSSERKIEPLGEEDKRRLFEIITRPDRSVGVDRGNEVVVSYDSGTTKFNRCNVEVSKLQSLQIYERLLGADTLEFAHIDYSYKPVKPIVVFEQPRFEQALLTTIPPLFYGAMPNLGLYSQPDGPCPNPGDLLPKGQIKEARESYEK